MAKATILAAAILLCLQTGITQAQDAPDGSEDADSLDTIFPALALTVSLYPIRTA